MNALPSKSINSYLEACEKVKLFNGGDVLKKAQLVWSPKWKGPIRVRLHGKQSYRQVLITQFFKRKNA
jgi:hypothetical protein